MTLHAPLIVTFASVKLASTNTSPTHFTTGEPGPRPGETGTPSDWTAGWNSEQREQPLTERSISQPLWRQEWAPQATGYCSLAEVALWPLADSGKQRDFVYRRSIKYHFKAVICNFLHVQTTAAMAEHLVFHLWSCFNSFLLACSVNVMTRQHQHKCINYWGDWFIWKRWHFRISQEQSGECLLSFQ